MFLKRTNIADKLANERKATDTSNQILREVQAIFDEDSLCRRRIEANIKGGETKLINSFNFDALESENIYHLSSIKKICIDYRLRFLDTKFFKGEIPQQTISKIKRLEQEHQIEIKGFKVLAPSKLFKLEDKDDPLLFAPIGNNYFYLIDKWGNDLHPMRKWMMWPFKSIVNLTVLLLVISYIITFLVPAGLFSKTNSTAEFWIIYFFMFKCIASITIFYGFALGKNFNPSIWNSKYFNA